MSRQRLRFASSWDDGDPLDSKVIALLKKHGLTGTFYLPGVGWMPDDLAVYDGFEIGAHTANHPPDMKLLDIPSIYEEIRENKEVLEAALLGRQPVTKFCYPRGRYDKRVISALRELGFTYARTTQVLRDFSGHPLSPIALEAPTSIHVYQRKEYEGRDWLLMAYDQAAKAANQGTVFHIWGHAKEIERDGNWDKLDMFFSWLKDNYEVTA